MAGCGARPTQPTIVVGPGDACTETVSGQSRDDAVLARARCEHPDMLIHPRRYLLRRIPSPPTTARYALDDIDSHQVQAEYEFTAAGEVHTLR